MATQSLSWREFFGAFFGLFIIYIPLIVAIVIPGLFFVTLSNIMASAFTMYTNSSKFISDFVNKSVKPSECLDLCKVSLLPTLNITLQNTTVFSLKQKVVNITIVNPSNVLVFVSLSSSGREEWVYTIYDASITAFFTDSLNVSVYPAFPFSDASPRKLALQENSSRTVHVSSQSGGVLNQLSLFLTIVGTLATIGVIKHVVATPLSNITSKSAHPFAPLIIFFYLNFTPLVVLLLTAVMLYISRNPGLSLSYLFLLLPFLLSISVLWTGKFWLGFAVFIVILVISLVFYGEISAVLQSLLLKLDFTTTLLILLFYVFYPFFYVLGKSAAFAFSTDRMFKLYLMYIYDATILLWAVQWLVNPYLAMLAWEYKFLGTILLPLIFGSIQIVISLTIFIFIIYTISYFITRARDISLWLLNLPGLSPSFSLTARYIRGLTWLLPGVPFVLNRELVARGELCASAERGVVKVRIHPEEGDPVEGVIIDCSLDKIAVDNGCERRVFSWGDVRQIELIGKYGF